MSSQSKLAGRILSVLLSLTILAACGGKSGSPTPDANAIFTAAAITVGAQLSQTAAAKPTSTNTPQPTNTSIPTMTKGTAGTLPALPGPGSTMGAGTSVVLPGLATATKAVVASSGDKCEWVRNDPVDGAVIDPSTGFDLVYTLKNTGTTTWTTNYKLRYYVGDYFTDGREFNLKEAVPAGSQGRAVADATSPSTKGTYKASFVLTNEQGVNFCVLDYTFTVGSSAEATNAPTSTSVNLQTICADSGHSSSWNTECSTFATSYCPVASRPDGTKHVYVSGVDVCQVP